jgi:hypothetical protein
MCRNGRGSFTCLELTTEHQKAANAAICKQELAPLSGGAPMFWNMDSFNIGLLVNDKRLAENEENNNQKAWLMRIRRKS